jgi:uncharacterized paraquat-inducible protein A
MFDLFMISILTILGKRKAVVTIEPGVRPFPFVTVNINTMLPPWALIQGLSGNWRRNDEIRGS